MALEAATATDVAFFFAMFTEFVLIFVHLLGGIDSTSDLWDHFSEENRLNQLFAKKIQRGSPSPQFFLISINR